jgi:hypothetical protein
MLEKESGPDVRAESPAAPDKDPTAGLFPSIEEIRSKVLHSLGKERMQSLAASSSRPGFGSENRPEAILNEYYKALSDYFQVDVEKKRSSLSVQNGDLDERIRLCRTRIRELASRRDQSQTELRELDRELPELAAKLQGVVYKVRQQQLRNDPAEAGQRSELLKSWTSEFAARGELKFRIQNADRELLYKQAMDDNVADKEENKRRADELQKEMAAIETQVNELSAYCSALRFIGITRRATTYLIGLGSVCLAGSSIFMSSLIERHSRFESHYDKILRNLRLLFFGVPDHPSGWVMLKAFAGIAALIVLLAVTTQFVLRLMGFAGGDDLRPKPIGVARKNNIDRVLEFLAPPKLADIVGTLTLQRVYGAIPYIAVTLLLIMAGIAVTPADLKWNSEASVFAIAYALAFTGISIVAGTTLLGPGLRRMLMSFKQTDELDTNSPKRFSWIFACVCFIGGALGCAGILIPGLIEPLSKAGEAATTSYLGWPLAPAGLFVVLGGFALPFGIVVRGIFFDLDVYQMRREFFRTTIARLLAVPTRRDIFRGAVSEDWDSATAASDYRNAMSLLNLMHSEWEDVEFLKSFFSEARVPGGAFEMPIDILVRHRLENPGRLMFYSLVEEPLISDFTHSWEKRMAALSSINALKSEIANLEVEIKTNEKELVVLVAEKIKAEEANRRLDVESASRSFYVRRLHFDDFTDLQEAAAWVAQMPSLFEEPSYDPPAKAKGASA